MNQRQIIFFLLGVAVLAGLFLFNRSPADTRTNAGTVKTLPSIDKKLLTEFTAQDDQEGKYTWLESVAKERGAGAAWAYLKAAYETPAGVVGNPHLLAHRVGKLIYKQYGFKGLSICETTFAFGCYHGLMEVAFDKEHPEAYTANLMKAQEGCKTVADVTSPSYWSCIHGMGHGIATFRDHNLSNALTDCDLLEERVRTYCHDGVFMEFSISALPNFYHEHDPIYPCNTVGASYQVACARSQAQVMRFRLKMDTPEIAQTCLDTRNDTIAFHCIDAVGYYVGQTSGGDASKVVSACAQIKGTAAAAQCTAAAAGELVFQNYAGWQSATTHICDSLAGAYKESCAARVDNVVKSYERK